MPSAPGLPDMQCVFPEPVWPSARPATPTGDGQPQILASSRMVVRTSKDGGIESAKGLVKQRRAQVAVHLLLSGVGPIHEVKREHVLARTRGLATGALDNDVAVRNLARGG